MTDSSFATAGWRTSSRCGSGSACVQVALGRVVGLRDSTDPDGTVLVFAAETWRTFLADVRAGRFDRST